MGNNEYEVLQILWKENQPMNISEIAQKIPNLREITVRRNIERLLKKNYIKVKDAIRVNTVYARRFVPEISPADYCSRMIQDLDIDPFRYVCALTEEGSLTESQMDKLTNIIEQQKQKLL